MKKYFIVSLIGLSLALSGCSLGIKNISELKESNQGAIKNGTTTTAKEPENIKKDRILLTEQNQVNYSGPQACSEVLNVDPANTRVIYSNSDKGISLQVPYNENWGGPKYKLNPFDFNDDVLYFGAMEGNEGCSWSRTYSLTIKPAASSAKVVAGVEKGIKAIKKKINNLDVVEYAVGDMWWMSNIEIIGKNYNYQLSAAGVESYAAEDMRDLENIVKTIKLITISK